MTRASPLDNIGYEEFMKIVQEMKPKIGALGGRYFVKDQQTYTMNQITKKYLEMRDSYLGGIIYEKDQQATNLLKNANCFQRWMTKIKQNWGNSQFKSHYPQFIGKEVVLNLLREVGQPMISTPVSLPQTQSIQTVLEQKPQPLPQPIEPILPPQPTNVEAKVDQKYLDFVSGKMFKEELGKITPPLEENYYEILEDYRKKGYFKMAQLSYVIKDKVPEQFLTQIFTKLVYNACVEIKEKNDYIFDIQPIAIIANPNHEEMYFDVAEIFLAEGNLEKATEILEKIFNHKHSERAQKLNVNIGMAKIDRISIEDEELNALDPQKWLGFAQLYFNFKRYQIERDAFIIAAKICWKQGYLARALEILSNCTLACPIIAHKNSEAFKEYLKTDGEKDFNIALEILTA